MSTANFVERRRTREWPSAQHALADAVTTLQARGATFSRAHITALTRDLIVEGWIEHPRDQGDLPV